jgi:hypothetical protein
MDFCKDIAPKITKSAYFRKSGHSKIPTNLFAEYAVSYDRNLSEGVPIV